MKIHKIWFYTDEVNGKERYYWKLTLMLLSTSSEVLAQEILSVEGIALKKGGGDDSFHTLNIFIAFKII